MTSHKTKVRLLMSDASMNLEEFSIKNVVKAKNLQQFLRAQLLSSLKDSRDVYMTFIKH
jgi:hypothetical protein